MTQEKLPAEAKPALPKTTAPTRSDKPNLAMFPGNRDAGDAREINAEAALALIAWAEAYGLDAWAGHACYMYGRPYVTERGAVANASRDLRYRGYSWTRVPDANVEALGCVKGSLVYECSVRMRDFEAPVTELGEVTLAEIAELERLPEERRKFLPLWKTPGKVARARSIRRAHLLAVPLQRRAEEVPGA